MRLTLFFLACLASAQRWRLLGRRVGVGTESKQSNQLAAARQVLELSGRPAGRQQAHERPTSRAALHGLRALRHVFLALDPTAAFVMSSTGGPAASLSRHSLASQPTAMKRPGRQVRIVSSAMRRPGEVLKEEEVLRILQGKGNQTSEMIHRSNAKVDDDVDQSMLKLPRHSNAQVNDLLERVEHLIQDIQAGRKKLQMRVPSSRGHLETKGRIVGNEDRIYANNYVDLGDMEVIGFDYDYTLVAYKPALLYMVYDMALKSLIDKFSYPAELSEALPGYDPDFGVRGLAVDLQTGWICHLQYNYRVAAAFNGRERVSSKDIRAMFSSQKGGGILPPAERKKRLRPLNDLFSMVEACLLADVVQFFKDRSIPFEPRGVVTDVLDAVGAAHVSGAMHRAVVADLDKYIEPDARRHLRQMLSKFYEAGKKMMLVSNSHFWYVDAGMRHVVGDDWQQFFDVVVAPAGKPAFYTEDRPFREVSKNSQRVKFKPILALEKGEVYCDGSIAELMKLTGWGYDAESGTYDGSKVLYLGDSIFADLVDARRLYGWVTGAIVREIRQEMQAQASEQWQEARSIMHVLVLSLRLAQEGMGVDVVHGESNSKRQEPRSSEDLAVLDELENLAAKWRKKADRCISPEFGSIFRAACTFGHSTTLFGWNMRRHADLYSSRVENFRLYSTDHRFYPSVRIGNAHEAEPFADTALELLVARDDVAN